MYRTAVADLLVYVFVDVQHVHVLELKAVREWFVPRAKEFPLKTAKTRTGAHLYTTVGASVPWREVKKAVPAAVAVHLPPPRS